MVSKRSFVCLGRHSPRMESCQCTIPQRIAVIEPYQLHEHVGDEHAKVLDVARLVLEGHDLDARLLRSGSLCRRSRHLQDSARLSRDPRRLYRRARALPRRRPILGRCILRGCSRLRCHPQLRLWGLRDDGRGGGNPPRFRRNGRSTQGGRRRGVLGSVALAGSDVGVAISVGVGLGSIGGG